MLREFIDQNACVNIVGVVASQTSMRHRKIKETPLQLVLGALLLKSSV